MIYSNNKTLHNFWIINVASVALSMLFHDSLAADTVFTPPESTVTQAALPVTKATIAPLSRKIGVSGIYQNNEGVAYQFLNTLSIDLAKNRSGLFKENDQPSLPMDDASGSGTVDQYVLINGEKKHISTVMREQVVAATCRAAAETFSATDLGKTVKAIEQKIARCFVVELSKNRFADHAELYLPGEGSLPDEKIDKEYAFSLGSSFYTTTDSLKGEYALEFKALYQNCQVSVEHDFNRQETVLLFENSLLNNFLNVSASLCLEKEADGPTSAMISLAWQL